MIRHLLDLRLMMTPDPEAIDIGEPLDLWLWPHESVVRWWCPQHTGQFESRRPCKGAGPPAIVELRDRRARLALDAALTQALAGLLRRLFTHHERVRLHLSDELDPAWHAFPYEWLYLDGEPLHGRLSVAREWPRSGISRAVPARPVFILDLLPASDPVRPTRGLSLEFAQVISSQAVEALLAGQDPTGWGGLCILAHGSRDDEAEPFLLPDGSPWTLPTERGLPPLVILLACGDDEGNLIDEARRLIAAGAQTVLAPLGSATQEGAAHFLHGFLPLWCRGARVDDALCAVASAPESAGGAQRLMLLGRGDLRIAAGGRTEDLGDEVLVAAAVGGDPAALKTLLERLTWRGALAGRDIDEAEEDLCRLYQLEPDDEPGHLSLLDGLAAVEGCLQPLTRAWVVPFLAKLSEAYAHHLMPRFDAVRFELEEQGVPVTAPILHAWSRLNYRRGRYGRALADVLRGLAMLEPGEHCGRGADIVRHFIGLLIALDLPGPAERFAHRLEDCLAKRHDDDADWQRHLLGDALARIALRRGEPRVALIHYRQKRAHALRRGEDGDRELASLHYVTAWLDPDGEDEASDWSAWAREVQSRISHHLSASGDWANGNADEAYLLRACAAWGWRKRDRVALDLVLGFRCRLREQLFAGGYADAGPASMCFAYLTLAEREGLLLNPPIPCWDEIRTALANQRYFIELAAIARLMDRSDQCALYLGLFHDQRALPSGLSLPPWLDGGRLTDWGDALSERREHEMRVLLSSEPTDLQDLVESGLLPL